MTNSKLIGKRVKALKTDRMTGIKKGQYYKIVDEEYDGYSLKMKVGNKEIWFRNYYFDIE